MGTATATGAHNDATPPGKAVAVAAAEPVDAEEAERAKARQHDEGTAGEATAAAAPVGAGAENEAATVATALSNDNGEAEAASNPDATAKQHGKDEDDKGMADVGQKDKDSPSGMVTPRKLEASLRFNKVGKEDQGHGHTVGLSMKIVLLFLLLRIQQVLGRLLVWWWCF